MKKMIIFIAFMLSAVISSYAQKGQVWPSQTRQEFDIDADGNITKEYAATDYTSYYLFINNNEFIHCTETMTSLYKILSRKETADYIDYVVISEVGNQYHMRFSEKNSYIVTTSTTNGFSIYLGCHKPYNTKVFDNINR